MNAHDTKRAQSSSLEPSRLGHLSSSDIGMQDALGLNRQTRCAMDATEHQLKPKDSTLATAAQKTKPPSVPKAAIDTRDESDVPQVPSSLSPRIAAALKQSALSYPAFVHQLLASAFAGVQCWELQDLERLFWLSEHLGLDPLQRDIIAIESPTNLRYPIAFMVTLDGWVKLLHRHALFRGLEFHEGPEDQDRMPQWVSCTIYWEGFHCPWKVHEWATENRTDSPA